MDHKITLTTQEPIARGRMRLVYEYPGDPDRLIKVIRPEVIDQRWGSGQPWYKARRRFRQYISYMREISEFVAAYASGGKPLWFAQQVLGLIDTDLGLGLVLKAVRGKDGNLAPTITTMVINRSFDEQAEQALQRFIRDLVASDVIIADLHEGNLVYAHDPAEGHYFVMIDGLGQSNILPLKSVFPSLNRRSKVRHIERLRRRMAEIEAQFPRP